MGYTAPVIARLHNLLYRAVARKKPLYELLRSIPVFAALSDRELSLLESIVFVRTYKRGETVFREGTPGHGMFIIREGAVSLMMAREDGAAVELERLAPGSFIGELALFSAAHRNCSAVAREDSELVVFFKHDFLELIDDYPRLGVKILLELSRALGERVLEAAEHGAARGEGSDGPPAGPRP